MPVMDKASTSTGSTKPRRLSIIDTVQSANVPRVCSTEGNSALHIAYGGTISARAQAVLDAVCGARPCFRGLEKRLALNVTDIGQLVVEPYTEPADAVEAWTAAANMAGYAITEGGMRQMLQWACARRRCVRDLIGTLRGTRPRRWASWSAPRSRSRPPPWNGPRRAR